MNVNQPGKALPSVCVEVYVHESPVSRSAKVLAAKVKSRVASSATAWLSIALATVGASLELATVTVAAIVTVTESSPLSVVPPLSCRVVIVTTRLFATVGASSVFLYARALIKVSIAVSEIPPASAVQVMVAVVPSIVTTAAPLLVAVFA